MTTTKNEYPYLTRDVASVPGLIKERFEDFQVEEIPSYAPSGSGDHVYFGIEKSGVTTIRAVRQIARALDTKPRNIGSAGMKDAHGVTRQTLSLEHVDPKRIEDLDVSGIKILWVDRHRNKLKTGHLRGNRFLIKLRQTDVTRINDVQEILTRLKNNGIPNYFGPQRFGDRGDTWQVGRALLLEDWKEAIDIIAGRPGPLDTGKVLEARQLFSKGEYENSARAWPRGYDDNAGLCRGLSKRPREPRRVVLSMDRRMLSLYVSAYQSYRFNQVLAARIDKLGVMEVGDLAWKHDKGVVFEVEDLEAENIRAGKLEISPSGPMFGQKMSRPSGDPGQREEALLQSQGLTMDNFPKSGSLRCVGGRRPLRFLPHEPIAEAGSDEHGDYIEIRFGLESGCYATVLLGEICKDQLISM